MDCPVWQAGMDHDVDFPAIVSKMKPVNQFVESLPTNSKIMKSSIAFIKLKKHTVELVFIV